MAELMAEKLGYSEKQFLFAPQDVQRTVLSYYIPITLWLEQIVAKSQLKENKKMPLIGLSIPMCARSTLLLDCVTTALKSVSGLSPATIRYEDFHVTAEEH